MPDFKQTSALSDLARKRLAQRQRAEQRFRFYGQMAVAMAGTVLLVLLFTIVGEARSAFTRHSVVLPVPVEARTTSQLLTAVRTEMSAPFDLSPVRSLQNDIASLVSPLTVSRVAKTLDDENGPASGERRVELAISDEADQYLKGRTTKRRTGTISVGKHTEGWVAADGAAVQALLAGVKTFSPLDDDDGTTLLSSDRPSLLLFLSDGVHRVRSIEADRIGVDLLAAADFPASQAGRYILLETPADLRSVRDRTIAVVEVLRSYDMISRGFNAALFLNADSNEAELAGVLAALTGTVLMILVAVCIALPIGVSAAVYLEEFAPDTPFTRLVTVNINNLASVPSIVFGLLGAAVLVNGIPATIPFTDIGFSLGGGLGRGWPLVGGAVLAIMTLPTVIISSRAAIASVPQGTREAAFSLGASRMQAVAHHVLPQAVPGIMTGSIIGLARAIGETAPLLLLGMFAFIAEVPDSVTDRSNALPVLIFDWSTRAERAFEPLTAAAIVILLLIMLVMNALAIWIRMKYEQRRD